MPDKKTSTKEKKCQNCECSHCSIFPIVFLACMLTAALVALGFAVGITASVAYRDHNDFLLRSAGSFKKISKYIDSTNVVKLDAPATIDFFGSGQTGFIYTSAGDCKTCASFKANLSNAIEEQGVKGDVFQYVYPTNPTDFDKYVHEMTIAIENEPVLLYVREGRIYDRLDETNGDLAVKTFLAKYKR